MTGEPLPVKPQAEPRTWTLDGPRPVEVVEKSAYDAAVEERDAETQRAVSEQRRAEKAEAERDAAIAEVEAERDRFKAALDEAARLLRAKRGSLNAEILDPPVEAFLAALEA